MSSYLITGGTGSMGQALTRTLLTRPDTERVAVFSRDEVKQELMQQALPDERLRWFLGDVRDRDRLRRAMRGVEHVIHTAALKQVPACERDPLEAMKTNVVGTANVIDAALDADVARVLLLSTDKACDPCTTYGASKLMAERLIVDANVYGSRQRPLFAATRYGNVLTSRGSVLMLFQEQHARREPMTVTDPGMTRFAMTVRQAADFVLARLADMQGGEVFVPKLPGVSVDTIARAVSYPDEPEMTVVGARGGEKQHELLMSAHEAIYATVEDGYFTVRQATAPRDWMSGFRYASDRVKQLTVEQFRELAGLHPDGIECPEVTSPAVGVSLAEAPTAGHRAREVTHGQQQYRGS